MNNKMLYAGLFLTLSLLTFGCAKSSDSKVVQDGNCTSETVNAYNEVVYSGRAISTSSTTTSLVKLQNSCNNYKGFIGGNSCKLDLGGVTTTVTRNSHDGICNRVDQLLAQGQPTTSQPVTVNYCSDTFQKKHELILSVVVDRYTTASEFLNATEACSSMPSEALGEKPINCVHNPSKTNISSVGTIKKCQFINSGFLKNSVREVINDPKRKLTDSAEKLKIRFKEDASKSLVELTKLGTDLVIQDALLLETQKAALLELPLCVLKKMPTAGPETVFEKKDAVYKSIVTNQFSYEIGADKKVMVTMTSAQSKIQVICTGKESNLATVNDLKKIFGQKMDVDLAPFDLE